MLIVLLVLDNNIYQEGQSIFSISRKELNAKLIDIAERSHVGFYFNQECQDINFDTSTRFTQRVENSAYDSLPFGGGGFQNPRKKPTPQQNKSRGGTGGKGKGRKGKSDSKAVKSVGAKKQTQAKWAESRTGLK